MSWQCSRCSFENDADSILCDLCRSTNDTLKVTHGKTSAPGVGAPATASLADRALEPLPISDDEVSISEASDTVEDVSRHAKHKGRAVLRKDGISVRSFVSSELCRPKGSKAERSNAATAPTFNVAAPNVTSTSKYVGSGTILPPAGASKPLSPAPVLDPIAAESWEWPTNPDYADREYQQEIVAAALFANTLVSLPTGLGKTFIAAVVMHNYFRWFPTGQVVFLAPTRPLVTQQIEACFRIVKMPARETAHMQGSVKAADRAAYWASRRVFYCTPQTFCNDLKARRANARRVVLVVVDEAHRSTGNHSFVQCIRELDAQHARYRVLALSATPGSDLNQVNDVIKNLHIGRIEVRTHDDASVAKYRNETTVDKITVPISPDIERLREDFMKVMDFPYRVLVAVAALPRIPLSKLNTMTLLKARQDFVASRTAPGSPTNVLTEERYRYLLGHFTLLLNCVPALRELVIHGSRSFYTSLKRIESLSSSASASRARKELTSSELWMDIMRSLAVMDFSGGHVLHPKLSTLQEVLEEHFERKSTAGQETRAIIFTQTRSSVDEILQYFESQYGAGAVINITEEQGLQPFLAGRHQPAGRSRKPIRAAPFVGQSRAAAGVGVSADAEDEEDEDEVDARKEEQEAMLSSTCIDLSDDVEDVEAKPVVKQVHTARHSLALQGQSQKDQAATLVAFKQGIINTLVATCIGEEGLDIGDVGIIVMFDAVKSPIRTIQRLGRTGRKNAGECKCLVTEAESKKFEDAFRQYRKIAFALKQAAQSTTVFQLYKEPSPLVMCAPSSGSQVIKLEDAEEDYVASVLSGSYTRLLSGTTLPALIKKAGLTEAHPEFRQSQVAGLGRSRPARQPGLSKGAIDADLLKSRDALSRAFQNSANRKAAAMPLQCSTSSAEIDLTGAVHSQEETQPDIIPTRPLSKAARHLDAVMPNKVLAISQHTLNAPPRLTETVDVTSDFVPEGLPSGFLRALEELFEKAGPAKFAELTVASLLNHLVVQGCRIPDETSPSRKVYKKLVKDAALALLTAIPRSLDTDNRVNSTEMTQSQAPGNCGLKRLRKVRADEPARKRPEERKPVPKPKSKRPRLSESEKASIYGRYLDLEAGVDKYREDSQASVDSDGNVLPGHGGKDDRYLTRDGYEEEDLHANSYDLEDSFINDDPDSPRSGSSSSCDSVLPLSASLDDSQNLGRINSHQRKQMPVLSRLLSAIKNGEDIIDDDESLIGSEIDDLPFLPSQSDGCISSQDTPQRPPRQQSKHVIEEECTKCGACPIGASAHRCRVCPNYLLCELCYPKRGVLHTEEFGFEYHSFATVCTDIGEDIVHEATEITVHKRRDAPNPPPQQSAHAPSQVAYTAAAASSMSYRPNAKVPNLVASQRAQASAMFGKTAIGVPASEKLAAVERQPTASASATSDPVTRLEIERRRLQALAKLQERQKHNTSTVTVSCTSVHTDPPSHLPNSLGPHISAPQPISGCVIPTLPCGVTDARPHSYDNSDASKSASGLMPCTPSFNLDSRPMAHAESAGLRYSTTVPDNPAPLHSESSSKAHSAKESNHRVLRQSDIIAAKRIDSAAPAPSKAQSTTSAAGINASTVTKAAARKKYLLSLVPSLPDACAVLLVSWVGDRSMTAIHELTADAFSRFVRESPAKCDSGSVIAVDVAVRSLSMVKAALPPK